MQPSAVLAALAELAPPAGDRVWDVTRGGHPLCWIADTDRTPRQAAIDRLAAFDALHREERILRRGWGFLLGRTEIDGAPRKIRLPLLSQPIHLERGLTGYRIVPAGDLEITPLVQDRSLAAAMEAAPGLATPGWIDVTGGRAWLWSAAEATGLPVDAIAIDSRRIPSDRLVLIAEAALFVDRDVFGVGLGDSLRSWAGRDLDGTALAALYGEQRGAVEADESAVLSPLPLTDAQATVVMRARTAPVSVVSGPPGNGKSHAVIAAALEVVQRGGSVLVATQSPHAADVLAELLARHGGPVPVLFGDAERRNALAAELAAGQESGLAEKELRADRAAVDHDLDRVREARRTLLAALECEEHAAALATWQPLLSGLAADVPGAFDDAVPLDRAAALLARRPADGLGWGRADGLAQRPADGLAQRPADGLARRPADGLAQRPADGLAQRPADGLARGPAGGEGWWQRLRGEAAYRRGRRLLRVASGVPENRVTEAIRAATAQRAAARLAATGGTDLAARWAALHDAEAALTRSVGHAMRRAARGNRRWTAESRRAAAALATALRAGRNRRRELLAALDGPPLIRAFPLWIGTVSDVEDLLPATPGLFELVLIDEASHVDQIRAAPVLVRARRALIVGDPRQLRFVSFVSDVDMAEVLARHGADDRLDVRRVSTYDLAAGAAPTTWLDEHHRSTPHLIGFSAHRFYDDRIAVTTRHPRTESADAIDVVRVSDATTRHGVNAAEVSAVVDVVRGLAEAGRTGIGVISPFRAQAEAIEAALLSAFPVETIEAIRLRSGTVHAFQGSEAQVVVASLGLAPDDAPGRRRFLADPHLFNVMITRARERLIVVTSLASASGLLGDYLAYADKPPRPILGAEPTGWAETLTRELHRLGLSVRPDYAVGAWRLDLCVGPAESAVGVLCGVHPDGPAAHLARQRALHRTGWSLIDGFPSRWQGDPRRAALEIAQTLHERQ